ncbi:MAG: hypothetical protein LLG40_09275 [Deltaproteobacteria bacterium]|nr:hypothetical protein [Deltaproteobacteria bacterium]
MASKSKDVRIEQLRLFEKKLALRLQQLEQKGISKEKAQNDSLVKSLKSKIKQTNARIAAFDKFVRQTQELAAAKAQKLAEAEAAAAKEPAAEEKQAEPKPKKKAAAEKEPKKQSAGTEEAAPKKAKKQAAETDEAAPKKKAAKKKEE